MGKEERENGGFFVAIAEEEVEEERGMHTRCLMKCGGDLKEKIGGCEITLVSLMWDSEIWCIIFFSFF